MRGIDNNKLFPTRSSLKNNLQIGKQSWDGDVYLFALGYNIYTLYATLYSIR